jgi:hypothetical protein
MNVVAPHIDVVDPQYATYEELQAGYKAMRDSSRDAYAGWNAERRKLWAAEAAIVEALRWLDMDGNTGSGYVNRIWGAKAALEKVSAAESATSPDGVQVSA